MKTERDTELAPMWAVHLIGPDDVQAAPSEQAATTLATAMRDYLATRKTDHPNEPKADAAVILWPGTRESHAQDLQDWPRVCRDWGIQP